MEEGTILFILLLLAFFAIFYFLLIRPQRKREREHQLFLSSLKRGDKVITIGGIYGEIEFIDEESVVLKVEDGGKLRVRKNSIAGRWS